jgi:NodT family efflux transporter outer membrane factor (OMF) lipoprotein
MPLPFPKPFLLGMIALYSTTTCSFLAPVSALAQDPAPVPSLAGAPFIPASQWWLAFRDPELDRLISEALETNPSLTQARARVDSAWAQAELAGASRLPRASVNASVSPTKQSYNNGFPAAFVPHGYKNSARATLDLSYDLDLWGKARNQRYAGIDQAHAAEAEAYAAQTMIALNVADTWFNLARLEAEQAATERVSKGSDKRLGLTASRVEHGIDPESEQLKQGSTDTDIKSRLLLLEQQIAATRNALAVLLGARPERALSLPHPALPASSLEAAVPQTLPAELLGRRPDIASARLRAEAAGHGIKVAKAAFYPNINLSAYFGAQSLGLDAFTKSGSDIGSFGPAISLPIFSGGALKANLRGAEAEYEAARAQYEQTLNQALQDVSDAGQALRTAAQQTTVAEDRLKLKQRAFEQTKQRYERGLTTLIDVLNSDAELLQAQVTTEDMKTQKLHAELELIRALGGGFRSDDTTPAAALSAAR